MKDLAYYLALPYAFTLMPDPEEHGYAIKVNELPGCLSQGDTQDDAMRRVREAMELWLETALEDGAPIPEPAGAGDDEGYSGKFLVRVPRSVHRALAQAAERDGVSLNLFAASALSAAAGAADVQAAARRGR